MSLKGSEYENAQEANFRLAGTVVLYDGKPAFIAEVRHEPDLPKGDIFRVYCQTLPYNPRNDLDRRYISSGKFDLTPIRMGFMNYEGNVFYLSRNSARQNRQGLNETTLSVEHIDPNFNGVFPRFNRLIERQEFMDTIEGKYPSVEDAVRELAKNDVKAMAISREYALAKHSTLDELLTLYHKKTLVGFMAAGEKTFLLGKKFKFLKEELEERKIPFKC